MIEMLYERMGLPQSAHLDKRIYKKMFHDNAKLSATDKKTLSEDVDTITWAYTLKPSTIPIQPFVDDECEYAELAIIQVDLKERKRSVRLAEIIHRAIPYPVVLIFAHESSNRISLATKRFSEAVKDAIVVDEFFATDWIDLAAPIPIENRFLDSLAVAALPHTHFKAFYDAWVDRVFALGCAARTGHYILAGELRAARSAVLATCRDLDSRIAEERAALKKEAQFNRQVEGNMRIKQMEKELAARVATL